MITYDGSLDTIGIEADNLVQFTHLAMFHELIRQTQTDHFGLIAVIVHPFQYGRAQTTLPDTVLYGDDTLELPSHLVEDLLVEWFQEAHVVVGDGY